LTSNDAPASEADIETRFITHGHLPAAAAYCRRLGLVDLVNTLVPSEMELKPGLAVQAMVLDTLTGRTPLYRVKDFMAGEDVELLLGERVRPGAFSDTNLGRALDAVFEAGPARIVTELGIRASWIFSLDRGAIHYDTTSVSVWGDYRSCGSERPPPGPVVARGHSKDKRPDLKQIMVELLCVDRGVPVFGRTLDGNSSDKNSNNRILSRIGAAMARHGLGPGAFIYVADSAMVTEENLDAIGSNLFVTRLPLTYGECARAVAEAVDSGAWTEVGALAENAAAPSPSRPCAEYKTFETTVTLYGKTYRAVVVHSSAHDKRRRRKLARVLNESGKAIKAKLGKTGATFFCAADAEAAARRAEAFADKLHSVTTVVGEVRTRARGRTPNGAEPRMNTRHVVSWEIKENAAAVEREKSLAGCFVLLTNIPLAGGKGMKGGGVLKTYKGQYVVESDFAFLKDPLITNDIFLKTPSRIDALGMVLIISLMVWRLMERSMRAHVQNTRTMLPGWRGRMTQKPTAFMMSAMMVGIMVALSAKGRRILRSPDETQLAYLAAMGLGASVFIDPLCKCEPIIPSKIHDSG